ncbi:hypothetical protein O3M35_002202 [Rhynocoris fuscipes]|uniref:Chitin-binding type-2 domain-containing protein n=1 Tax=Rhynocoris fuscipes TaxID=488301 RepID=A0AAW1CQB1_9HEMI
MYWSHLIFALFGVLVFKGLSAAKPGYLDFDNLPETNFSCENKVIGGYYADIETGCQMFHVCTIGQKGNGEITDIKFLCLNGTVFDQETRVCERIDEVDCSKSEDFFGLNLELYGNNGHQGIQAEEEFDCEDCSTEDEDDYEDTTGYTTSTTTTTTTSTQPPTTTTSKPPTTRPPNKPVNFPTSSPETIAALLALHNAFTLSLQKQQQQQQQQQQKVNAPPPRLINSAFASTTKPTQKPFYSSTQHGNINLNLKTHYSTATQDYSSATPVQQQRPKPFYQVTTPQAKSNYHHFQSGDTSFGHSFDSEKPYNFQYFHSRRIEEPQTSSIQIVTSTSTSTSIRTSKPNATDFPTGYDYTDGEIEPFFRDVPKIRGKREELRYSNHRYPDEKRYSNHKYSNEKILSDKLTKEEFLSNMLDSIDMDEHDRKKLVDFFLKENNEMKENVSTKGLFKRLGETVGELIREDINKTNYNEEGVMPSKPLQLELWKDHFEDMSQELAVDFKVSERIKRDLVKDTSGNRKIIVKRQVRRGNIDTEKFAPESGRRRRIRTTTARTTEMPKKPLDVKPVSEEVDEGDFTTTPYRRVVINKRIRNLPSTTQNIEKTSRIHFNYESTTAITPGSISSSAFTSQQSEIRRRLMKPVNLNITRDVSRLKEVPVYEDIENPASSDRIEHTETSAPTVVPNNNSNKRQRTNRGRGRVLNSRTSAAGTTTTTTSTSAPTIDPTLIEDPNFSCEGKVKGGFYADVVSDCRGFFICSQGQINGPLLKSHFWCGATTKFNQRSRTCQADYLVECSISDRYYHLNNDFLVPAAEEELKPAFEPMRVKA